MKQFQLICTQSQHNVLRSTAVPNDSILVAFETGHVSSKLSGINPSEAFDRPHSSYESIKVHSLIHWFNRHSIITERFTTKPSRGGRLSSRGAHKLPLIPQPSFRLSIATSNRRARQKRVRTRASSKRNQIVSDKYNRSLINYPVD